jgi:hypothetical protein
MLQFSKISRTNTLTRIPDLAQIWWVGRGPKVAQVA